MARSSWNIYKKVAGSWTLDGTIYKPNDSLDSLKITTQTKTLLADGNTAYITPATKYKDEPIAFVWYFDDGTVKTKIEAYIDAQNDIKIIDQNSKEYIGRFTAINSTWLIGYDTDRYDIKVSFEIMPSIA